MNIFYLNHDTKKCAQEHVNRHCVKMILEQAQILSTAHRVLDGTEQIIYNIVSNTGKIKQKKVLVLSDSREQLLYKATHINHPSTIWARKSASNYLWLHSLTVALCEEYTYRYGKTHKCSTIGLVDVLKTPPNNIPITEFTEPTPAMPEEYKVPGNSAQSYRNYYNGEKQRMFVWKNRPTPDWILNNTV